MTQTTLTNPSDSQSITHIWTRLNTCWLKAGALSGIAAGTIMMIVAGFIAQAESGDFLRPYKLIAAVFYGSQALAFVGPAKFFIAGILLHTLLCSLFGATFAQLVHENSKMTSLISLGFVTSFIIWIFGLRFFAWSTNPLLVNSMSISAGLYFHLAFGILFGIILGIMRKSFIKN